MTTLRRFLLLAALSPGVFACSMLAQTASESPAETSAAAPSDATAAPAEETPSSTVQEQPAHYVAALDGVGLISLGSDTPSHFLYGANVSGGWDSNPELADGAVASGFYTMSPYLALRGNTPKSQYLFQYQLTATGYNSNYARETLHTASASIIENPTARLNLDLEAIGSYGPDALRFLGAQQTVAVGDVAGTGPSSAAYLGNLGNATYLTSSLTSNFQVSQRTSLQLQVADSSSRYSNIQGNTSIATANLSLGKSLSPTLGVSAYALNSYYYGSLHCESHGVGVGLRWRPSEKTSLTMSGGPQFETPECGAQQGFAYNVALGTSVSGKSQIYVLAGRQPTTSYLGPGLWQDNVSAGYERQVTRVGAVNFDAGYIHSSSLATVDSYQGTYFDCIYSYALGHGLQGVYNYRGYISNSGGTSLSRNVVMFSVDWAPGRARSLVR